MFILELQADNFYSALGRLLDQTRVAGLKITALDASEDRPDSFSIRATIDEMDRETVEKLGGRIAKIFGVSGVGVRPEPRLYIAERPLAAACSIAGDPPQARRPT